MTDPRAVAPARRDRLFGELGGSLLLLLLALAIGLAAVALGMTTAAAVLLAPIGAIVAARHPTAAVLGLFMLTGFAGTLAAYTPLSARPATDLLLVGLWLGVLWGVLAGRERRLWLWPGLLAPAAYIVITAIEALLTEPASQGLQSFRLASWAMGAFLLVALAPWTPERRRDVVRVALLAAAAVGLFGVFRWITGPSVDEEAIARAALPGLPYSTELRFYGPQATAQQLVLWCGAVLPFALAVVLGWRGRWQLLAIGVVALSGFLVVATEVRTGAVAALAAAALVLLLYQLSVAFPGGTRLGTSLAALLAIGVLGVGGFTLTVGSSDDRADRFLQIFSPGDDPTYSTRVDRWTEAWPQIVEEPLGHGLGTIGTLALEGEFVPETALNLDSSYLKVGLEQGPVLMVLFAGALLLLLVSLARRAIATPDRSAATIAIGASGSLLALIVMFYAGFYVENLQVLAGWILVGLGAAELTQASPPPPAPPPEPPRRQLEPAAREHAGVAA